MHINLIPEDMHLIVKHLRSGAERTKNDAELTRILLLMARLQREIEQDDVKRAKQAEYRAAFKKRTGV